MCLSDLSVNKIIPKCVGVVSKEGTFKVPTECPVCGERTHISENEVSGTKVLQCSNKECPAKNLSRFVRFVSKPGLDIDGLSIKTISNFINRGFISKFPDIFELSKYANIIANIEGFGEKSVGNLIAAIENSKKVNPINFIFSLSIPLIGTDTAKKIINKIGYEEFVRRSKNKVGFENENHKNTIELTKALQNYGIIPEILGRLPVIARLNKLTIDDLQTILLKPKKALIKQYESIFALEEVAVEFSDGAIYEIAKIAYQEGLGARALKKILEDMMLDYMFDIPSNKDIKKIEIKKEDVLKLINKSKNEKCIERS